MPTKYAGYTGKVMLVDLTTETISEYPWSDRERELYLGGKIMANKILFDRFSGKEQAFSEENWIIITTGPLTLSGAPSSTRYDITAISPMSGLPESSNCGGDFGLHLKKAGYDALILSGRCRSHRWLEIQNDTFTFHDAENLWGMLSDECQEQLDQLMNTKKYGKLYIGPAGENTVRYASVLDGTHTSGRIGIGAVFGWKNLKAITVTGSHDLPIYDKENTVAWKKKWFLELHSHPLTGKNSRSGTPTSKACPGCPILCRRQFNKGADAQTDFLNQLGMDSVSAQDAVSWAMAARELGILAESLPEQNELYESIAFRRGIGNDLAEGVKYLSKKYGFKMPKQKKSAADKHNRNDGYPAILKGWGLDLETMSPEFKLDCALLYMDLCEAVSAAGLCMFTVNAFCPAWLIKHPGSSKTKLVHAMAPKSKWLVHQITRNPRLLCMLLPLFYQTRMLAYVSGLKLTPGQFIEVGTRAFALEQILCNRFGGDTKRLPKMLAKNKDYSPAAYFAARKWDENGIPADKTISI
jgi:aldehyde:ferredoxin oxidoreductase